MMMTMIIAGVDLGGSKAAVAIFDDNELLSMESFESRAKRRQDQLYEVADFVEQMTAVADVVYIEEPLIGRGVRASLQVAQCAGAVLSQLSTDAYLVPVGTWKKVVVGNGSATKESVSFWLQNSHPPYSESCDGNQDLADATCIALYGSAIQEVARSLPAVLD